MQSRRGLRKYPTDVYRAFDAFGGLLYVGISVNAFKRLNQHRYEAPWYPMAFRFSIETYPNWVIARAVEGHVIGTERPEWNLQDEASSARRYAILVAAGSTPTPIDSFEFDAADLASA